MIHRDENSHIDRLSGDEAQIARVLSALPRIDAAKDFDFRLKAGSRSEDRRLRQGRAISLRWPMPRRLFSP